MNDTSPKVEELMRTRGWKRREAASLRVCDRRSRTLLMKRTPSEPVPMAFSMFDTARALVEASLKASGLVEGTAEFRAAYLQRMYRGELTAEQIDRIVSRSTAR